MTLNLRLPASDVRIQVARVSGFAKPLYNTIDLRWVWLLQDELSSGAIAGSPARRLRVAARDAVNAASGADLGLGVSGGARQLRGWAPSGSGRQLG